MPVIIKSTNGVGHGTQITDAESGKEVHGVTEAVIAIRPDDVVRVDLQIFAAQIEVKAVPTFVVTDPATGETKAVSQIQFADGSAWEAPN